MLRRPEWRSLSGYPAQRSGPPASMTRTPAFCSIFSAFSRGGLNDTNTKYDPSAERAGCRSTHPPENGAICGSDQWSPVRCDSTMIDQVAPARVKKIVFPSGVNVGDPSFAGPEITPGSKIWGEACAWVAAEFSLARVAGTGWW
jgi:hypothetical protein